MRVAFAASIEWANNVAQYLWQTGESSGIVTNAAGDVTLQFTHGLPIGAAVFVGCVRDRQAGGDMRSLNMLHTNATNKQFQTYQEIAGPDFVLTEMPFDVVCVDTSHDVDDVAGIHCAARVTWDDPAYSVVHSGQIVDVTINGVGDVNLNLQADWGVDADECAILVTPRGQMAAGDACYAAVLHNSDVQKRITLQLEQVGVSILAHMDFDVVIVTLNKPKLASLPGVNRATLRKLAAINSNLGAVPPYLANDGSWNTIVNTALGQNAYTTMAPMGLPYTSSACVATPKLIEQDVANYVCIEDQAAAINREVWTVQGAVPGTLAADVDVGIITAHWTP